MKNKCAKETTNEIIKIKYEKKKEKKSAALREMRNLPNNQNQTIYVLVTFVLCIL